LSSELFLIPRVIIDMTWSYQGDNGIPVEDMNQSEKIVQDDILTVRVNSKITDAIVLQCLPSIIELLCCFVEEKLSLWKQYDTGTATDVVKFI
jgi:hypothetical protein